MGFRADTPRSGVENRAAIDRKDNAEERWQRNSTTHPEHEQIPTSAKLNRRGMSCPCHGPWRFLSATAPPLVTYHLLLVPKDPNLFFAGAQVPNLMFFA